MQWVAQHLRLPALLTVLAAHVLALVVLLRPEQLYFPTASAPSLINLISTTRSSVAAVSGVAIEPLRITVSPYAPQIVTEATANHPAPPPQSNIDWDQEIHRQASTMAYLDARDANTSRSSIDGFQIAGTRAARHATGEQFRGNDGTWIVWINPACYQVSDHVRVPALTGQTLAATYCAGERGTR